jgi:hypothetical protein
VLPAGNKINFKDKDGFMSDKKETRRLIIIIFQT